MNEILRRRRGLMVAQGSAPVPVHGTWEDLFRAIDDGTYATDYSKGDTIELNLGSALGVMQMEISDFELDDKADGTGKAPITLISKNFISGPSRFNPALAGDSGNYTAGTGTIGGWKESELRGWYINTVLPAIPAAIRARIVQVIKASISFAADGTANYSEITNDYVFCPSYRESGRLNTESSYQNSTYTALNTVDKRKRNAVWGVRSAFNISNRGSISTSGSVGSSISTAANTAVNQMLCFCVG